MAMLTRAERERRRELAERGLKYCPKCDTELPVTDFARNAKTLDGLQSYCRSCVKASYRRDRDRRLEWQREYARTHKEEIKEKNQEYYRRNQELLQKYQRDYYQQNREEVQAKNRDYAQTERGREVKKVIMRRRKEREKGCLSTFTSSEWLAALEHFEHRCAYCGERSEILHQEHYIPARRGGDHSVRNIIPACPRCNLSKGARAPEIWASRIASSFVSQEAIQQIEMYFKQVSCGPLFD